MNWNSMHRRRTEMICFRKKFMWISYLGLFCIHLLIMHQLCMITWLKRIIFVPKHELSWTYRTGKCKLAITKILRRTSFFTRQTDENSQLPPIKAFGLVCHRVHNACNFVRILMTASPQVRYIIGLRHRELSVLESAYIEVSELLSTRLFNESL